ncbi:hypothetical protein AKJ09_02006 [Labilithrix luteola]|uniref:IgGFc-binding protein N-terminal domain-containing protein n=1 Tax=Labilithrix luteola TaxID=1391654 RepID=A0A0K1PPA3_9BACT|nr:hypothetical protein AKJ09_02006 [Labilithrix luteola]
MTDKLVTVRSQDDAHAFYAAMYMTGEQYSSIIGGRNIGDADFVNVIPSGQFLDRYVFFADYSFRETTLTIVRKKTETGFAPVELDCAGELTEFQPLGANGDYEYTWVTLTKDRTPQSFPKGTCNNGRNEARSNGPFALYVWGMDDAASYGYAGGAGLRALNPITPQIPK